MKCRAMKLALVFTFVLSAAPHVNAQLGGPPAPRRLQPGGPMQVILIGTGMPLPNPMRGTAATLVIAGDKALLVDTGRNCVVQLAESRIGELSAIFFTHYHSDHIAGFGELLVARGIAGTQPPLRVIGPVGAKRVVDGFRMAYSLDLSYRAAHHGDHWGTTGTNTIVSEPDTGVVYEADGVKVTMFEVDHDPIKPAVGYRFDYQGKVVVVSGDTIRTPKLVEMSRDADLLVHEAVDMQMLHRVQPILNVADPRRAAMLADVMEYHTSTTDVAEIARDAGVKKLVLTHLVPSIPPEETAEKNFVRGMAGIYNGPIIVGRDGMTIDID